MDQNVVNRAFESFGNLNALIIGDIMIDAYYWGDVNRISPEAPVPIIEVTKNESRLGGAANVALNVQSLGANAIMCAVIGQDSNGDLMKRLIAENHLSHEGIVQSQHRKTTIKTRIISQHQHMMRVDEEETDALSDSLTQELFNRIRHIVEHKNIDVIIFEDYDKGVITPRLIDDVVQLAKEHNIPTTVDPKKRNFLDYNGVTLFKPNLKELREGLNVSIEKGNVKDIEFALDELKKVMDFDAALITLSEYGVYVEHNKEHRLIPAHRRDISDVSGAGDTVIAVASLCLALGLDYIFSAQLANLAGGLVCEKVGVVPINRDLLNSEALRLSK